MTLDLPLDDSQTLSGHLGMTFFTEDGLEKATMPVDNRTCQKFGLLNGGASIALAETLAGRASMHLIGPERRGLGITVTANHMSTARFGSTVTATARPVKIGRTLHVWDVEIRDERDRLVSSVRVTNLITDCPVS